MSSEQAKADNIGGTVFITQPSKSVKSQIDGTVLIENNDPFLVIDNHLETVEEDFTSVVTTGFAIFKNLPFLSLQNFKKNALVAHILVDDFSYVTILRDLGYPILISQSIKEIVINGRLAYNLARISKSLVFHFYSEGTYENGVATPGDVLVPGETISDLLNYFNVKPFEIVNKVNGKHSILYLGQLSDELIKAATSEKALLIKINLYQPFQLKDLLKIIPAHVETISIVEQTLVPATSTFSPLLLDFFQDYSKYQQLKNFTKIVSASFVKGTKNAITNLIKNVSLEKPVQNVSYGVQADETVESATSTLAALKLEDAYLKVLNQVNPALNLLNEYNSKSTNQSNPEFGFGSFLADVEQSERLSNLVSKAIQKNAFNPTLLANLSKWLVQKREAGSVDSKLADEIVLEIETSNNSDLINLKSHFYTPKNWLVGSDAWSYDLGSSGVHNVLNSGQNINMLIIDSEPYQEKVSSVNGFRKKDVGLYAMNYGGAYVASVAIYSSYTQVLQALIEAEKFNGPSIVLAYLPYKTEFDNTLDILLETKKAVDSGYWPLYRYDPSQNERDTFKLDSSNLRKQLQDFLDRENKLTLLASKNPLLSRNLTKTANSEIKLQQAKIADEAFAKLLQGLSGPPLTVAFASDGGNGEALAKKVNRQALGRGLKSTVLAMDDLSIEDFPQETNVVFVVSTSGQGEFPGNGKQFWDALKTNNTLDLSSVRYSVLGLGDSQYWPRKEDKHYYNKPSKDLDAKLKLYGATELAEIGLGDDQDADGFSTGYNEWIPQIWKALGVDNLEGVEEPKAITNEDMKIGSDYLRGTIAEGLRDQSTGAISAVDQQLTKFHGIYMQDDRDIRDERKAQGLEPAYAFMVRLRLPGGKATPEQYLKLDELADERGNGTLKITTRATFQMHGVVKHDLKPAIRGMNSALLDTLAACGDVNRNVMVSALPGNAKVHGQISSIGTLISEHLLPSTTAYHEIWLEGADEGDKAGDSTKWEARNEGPKKKKTLVAGNALADVEPLYGVTYLPRKFKIVITVPPFNDVDVYAHDVGLIAIVKDNVVIGFNVVAGGGMGSTHNNKKTYPRTASMLGYVPTEEVHIACEKIMLVQRDFGDRTNRKHARLKYTVDDLGVEVFKSKVEELLGHPFAEPKEFKIDTNVDFFGWIKDETGLNHFTAFIENGRIEDTADLPQKQGLKEIAKYLVGKSGEFRLTGNQHLLISNVEDVNLEDVKHLLALYKLDNVSFSGLRLSSAACVAFPTCGLAMAESERYLPELITKLEAALEDYGLRHDSIVMRMTGCPNGCARPWVAEIALVGKALGAYNLMLGGGHHGERLNKIYRYSIKEDEILETLKPMFKRWSLERNDGEPFGDFVIRVGIVKPTLEGKYFHDDIPEEA